jgi:hypothetical protein
MTDPNTETQQYKDPTDPDPQHWFLSPSPRLQGVLPVLSGALHGSLHSHGGSQPRGKFTDVEFIHCWRDCVADPVEFGIVWPGLIWIRNSRSAFFHRSNLTSLTSLKSICRPAVPVISANVYLLYIPYTGISLGNVADPHQCDADPDSACHFDPDPDPACHFDPDPDPTFHFDAIRIQLITLMRIRILPFSLKRIHADPDPQQFP